VPSVGVLGASVVQPETGFKIYINNVDYTRNTLNYEFEETDNEISVFELELVGTTSSERTTDLLQDKVVRIESQGKLIFKGIVERPEYATAGEVKLSGYGAGESYCKRITADVTGSANSLSPPKRPIYENIAFQTIAGEQLANVSQVSLDSIDNGADFGNASIRGDYINSMDFLSNLAISKGAKWWFYYGTVSPFNDNFFHVASSRGSISSVKTFSIAGDNQNADLTKNEQDFENLFNSVTILGFGDGINQLSSTNFHATTTRSTLSSNISAVDTIIPLVDASSFPLAGQVWIGAELVTYTAKSGNNLTGALRAKKQELIDNFDDNSLQNFSAGWVSGATVTETSNQLQFFSGVAFSHVLVKNNVTAKKETSIFGKTGSVSGVQWSTGLYQDNNEAIYAEILVKNSGDDVNSYLVTLIRRTNGNPIVADKNYFYDSTINVSGIFVRLKKNVSGYYTADTSVDGLNWIGRVRSGVADLTVSEVNPMIMVSGVAGTTILIDDFYGDINLSTIAAYAHSKGIEVYDAQYTETAFQSDSSIDSFGLKAKPFQDKTIRNQDALDRIAQETRIRHSELVDRIEIISSNPYDTARSVFIGDMVTIVDSDAELNANFRVNTKSLKSDEGFEQCVLECSNERLTFTNELKETRKLTEIESRFMQGSTTAFNTTIEENASSFFIQDGFEDGNYTTNPVWTASGVTIQVSGIGAIKGDYSLVIFADVPTPAIGSVSTNVSGVGANIYEFETRLDNSFSGYVTYFLKDSSNNKIAAVGISGVAITFWDSIGVFTASGIYVSGAWFGETDVLRLVLEYEDNASTYNAFIYDDKNVLLIKKDNVVTTPAVVNKVELLVNDQSGLVKTFLDSVSYGGNADGDIVVDFDIPSDATIINSIDLSYSNMDVKIDDNSSGYTIQTTAYTTDRIRLFVLDDESVENPTWGNWTEITYDVERVLNRTLKFAVGEAEANIDLSAFYTLSTGRKRLRFITNGNSRHRISINVKAFIEARVV